MSAPSRAQSQSRRVPDYAVGLIAFVLVLIGFYLAFTKSLPWSGGYEVKGVFANAQNVAEKSPVRIAGVNVGEVTTVEPLPESRAAVLTMEIGEQGRPVREDARMQLRPRLFLEGNLFVELHPGSPSAPEVEEGHTFPIQQTSSSVQLDQILTTLQADVRGNMQLLLRELGDAFTKYGGAEGFRTVYRTGGPAFRNTALVNEAFLGTEPHDLSGLVRNFDRVARALDRNQPQLQDLVTNLRIVTGSFAAEADALETSVALLPEVLDSSEPVFANLNASFPALRAFAREALPGVRSTPETLEEATPFIRQLRLLVSPSELRGLVRDLRPAVPDLALLARRSVAFMEEGRALSSCFNQVIIPWSDDRVDPSAIAGEEAAGRVFEETGYGLAGIGGESRSGDANGQYIKVGVGGGINTIVQPPAVTGLADPLVGVTPFPILGSEPHISESAKTPFKPQVPCENQEPPDLSTNTGPAPQQYRNSSGFQSILHGPLADSRLADVSRAAAQIFTTRARINAGQARGITARRMLGLVSDFSDQLQAYRRKGFDRLYEDLVEELTGMEDPRG